MNTLKKNPYLKDKAKLREDLLAQALDSSIFEGARNLDVDSARKSLQRGARRKTSAKKAARGS